MKKLTRKKANFRLETVVDDIKIKYPNVDIALKDVPNTAFGGQYLYNNGVHKFY